MEMLELLIETRSISETARRLGLTQPAISKSLRELESLVGAPLFERHENGLQPTAYCSPVANLARTSLAGLERAFGEVSDLLTGDRGKVSVGVQDGVPYTLAEELILHSKRNNPAMSIAISKCAMRDAHPRLLDGTLDLVIGYAPLRRYSAGIKFHELGTEELSVLIPKGLAHGGGLRRWVHHPWVLPPSGERIREIVGDLLISEGSRDPMDLVECDCPANCIDFALRLGALTAVPKSCAATHAARHDFRTDAAFPVVPQLTYGLMRAVDRSDSPALSLLLSSLEFRRAELPNLDRVQ